MKHRGSRQWLRPIGVWPLCLLLLGLYAVPAARAGQALGLD
jgi:hypothetical protein